MDRRKAVTLHGLRLLNANGSSEIRLFVFGENVTTKGTFVLSRDSAEEILSAFEAYGNDLVIDYEHQTFAQKGGGPSPAAGWIRQGALSLKDDGLYAIVDWTEEAKALIKKRQYRYFSPSFEVDAKGNIVSLLPPALVNYPATIAMDPLAAKAVPGHAYPPSEGPWDANAAEGRVRKWASSDGSGDPATMDWPKYQKAFAWYDAANAETFAAYKLPHHDVVDGEIVTSRQGVVASVGALSGARGGVEIPQADVDGVREHLALHYKQFDLTPPWEQKQTSQETMPMKNVLTALKLKEDASEADALVAVGKLTLRESEILSLTGRASMSEAVGVLAAWKDQAARTVKLSEELAELEKAAKQREAEALLDAAIAANKVKPALRDSLLAKGVDDLPWLAAHLETLTPDAAHAKAHTQPRNCVVGAGLSETERMICKSMGVKESQFIEWRTKRAEG